MATRDEIETMEKLVEITNEIGRLQGEIKVLREFKAQSESEKFFAHLNNGGEIYVNGNGLGDFLITVLHPKAGE